MFLTPGLHGATAVKGERCSQEPHGSSEEWEQRARLPCPCVPLPPFLGVRRESPQPGRWGGGPAGWDRSKLRPRAASSLLAGAGDLSAP